MGIIATVTDQFGCMAVLTLSNLSEMRARRSVFSITHDIKITVYYQLGIGSVETFRGLDWIPWFKHATKQSRKLLSKSAALLPVGATTADYFVAPQINVGSVLVTAMGLQLSS